MSAVSFDDFMSADEPRFNRASRIKRHRAGKAEIEARRSALFAIIEEMQPMTVRQVFYQASVKGIVDKSSSGYDKVQNDLVIMRKGGDLPYEWLVDNTRWQRKPRTYNGVKEALESTARIYRKSLWADADAYVEIWLEKDALSGVIYPITAAYDVPLMVARGYASLTFLHEAAEYIADLDIPTFIYHFGDFDPSGVNAAENVEESLREMAPLAEIHFDRVAVTPDQIEAWDLPTRLTKQTDSRAKGFSSTSVELDAIPPGLLRGLVEVVINKHLPQDQFKVLKAAEESERRLIDGLVGMLAVKKYWVGARVIDSRHGPGVVTDVKPGVIWMRCDTGLHLGFGSDDPPELRLA